MKLLAATGTGHTPTTSGESDLIAGELLMPAEQCDRAHCMCRREFVAVTTMARTMHAKVVELDITEDQIRDIVRDYTRAVWPAGEPQGDEFDEEVEAYVQDIMEPAVDFEVGDVIERWGHELRDIRDNPLGPDD